MSNVKKILIIILSLSVFFTGTVFAQGLVNPDNKIKFWENLVNTIKISGKAIGYGVNCNYDKSKIEKIYNFINPYIQSLGTEEERKSAEKILINTVNEASEKGPVASNMNCAIFKREFELIVISTIDKNFTPRIYQMDKPPI